MQPALWDCPEVVHLLSAMCPHSVHNLSNNCPDVVQKTSDRMWARCAIVGALFRTWSLFDQHSTDGTLEHYDAAALNEAIGIEKWAENLQHVGWLIITPQSVVMPGFEKWMSQSAKRRLRDAVRKRMERDASPKSTSEICPQSVRNLSSEKRTRGEERRGQKSRDNNTNTLSSVPSERVSSTTKKLEPWTDELFNQFWKLYPRPIGKKVAYSAFAKAYLSLAADDRIPTRDAAQRIVDRAMEFAKSSRGKEQQYLPHPSTWLNQGRYLDNPTLWKESADSDGVPSLQEIFGGDFND